MSVAEIVAQVKAHPELWLPSHEHFRHRGVARVAWKSIANQLNSTDLKVKKRWKCLKDTYRKEVKKILSNQITKSYWQHYDEMSFISSQIFNYNTKKTMVNPGDSSDSDTDNDVPSLKKKLKKDPSPPSIIQANTKPPSSTKRPYLKTTLTEIKELIITKNRTADENLKQHNDPDYLFLMSLLPTLRRFTHLQKLQFRGKVNEWLIEAVTCNDSQTQCDENMLIQESVVVVKPELS